MGGEIHNMADPSTDDRFSQAWLDTESEYRLMEQKHSQAKEGAKYASEKYEKWTVHAPALLVPSCHSRAIRGSPGQAHSVLPLAISPREADKRPLEHSTDSRSERLEHSRPSLARAIAGGGGGLPDSLRQVSARAVSPPRPRCHHASLSPLCILHL